MEDITLFLGKVLGIYFLVRGIVFVAYFTELKEALEEFTQSKMLFYLSGQITFIFGLVMVVLHTIFVNDPTAIIVTIISYLTLWKGLMIMFLPHKWVNVLVHVFNRTPWYIVAGILSLLLGVALIVLTFVIPLFL